MPMNLHQLGQTRSVRNVDHILQTPDTFVRAPLPGMSRATAIVHVNPAMGAGFAQYTAEFESQGTLGPTAAQRFIYVLEGELIVDGQPLTAGKYAYIPAGNSARVSAERPSRAVIIEKHYQPLAGIDASSLLIGNESAIQPQPLGGDPWLEVRALLPDSVAFDFAMNTMTYRPGASLAMVEIHVMEHGLLMLEGGGIYRLGERWYGVDAGDFIWMAPYCPQWFGALGKESAKYLIYKNWNRHPLG